jgi:hypothetical protein
MSDPTSQPQDADRRENDAAEAEERHLDRETPDALDTLSETAQRFLQDPDMDAVRGSDLPDDASGEEPPQDGDPGR